MRSELGQRLRNNSNLLSRDTALQTAMSHQDASRIRTQIRTKKSFHAYISSHYVKNTRVCGLFYSHKQQHTYQRVNFHRKLVLLVLHR